MGIPGCSVVNNLPANVGDWGSIPGWGIFSGGGNGNPLQYSCLENPWAEQPGRLQSAESELDTTEHTLVEIHCCYHFNF